MTQQTSMAQRTIIAGSAAEASRRPSPAARFFCRVTLNSSLLARGRRRRNPPHLLRLRRVPSSPRPAPLPRGSSATGSSEPVNLLPPSSASVSRLFDSGGANGPRPVSHFGLLRSEQTALPRHPKRPGSGLQPKGGRLQFSMSRSRLEDLVWTELVAADRPTSLASSRAHKQPRKYHAVVIGAMRAKLDLRGTVSRLKDRRWLARTNGPLGWG